MGWDDEGFAFCKSWGRDLEGLSGDCGLDLDGWTSFLMRWFGFFVVSVLIDSYHWN